MEGVEGERGAASAGATAGERAGIDRPSRRRRVTRAALCAYYVAYVTWFAFSGTRGEVRTFVSDAAYLPLGVAGVGLAALASLRARGRDRAVWALLAAALALRLQGDGTWWWLEAVRHASPYPSAADAGYSGFYPVLIAALALMPVRPQSRRARAGNLLDVLAMTAGAFMLVWYLVLGSAVQAGVQAGAHGGFGGLEGVLNVVYPLCDLLLLLAAGRVVLRGSDPRWTTATRWLVAGALMFVVADVGFTYLTSLQGFTGGDWLDLFWVGALLCFALAALARPGTAAAREGAERHAHLLPVAAVVASYTVVAKVAVGLPLYPAGGVLLADLLITVVVLARQLLAVADHRALAARYRRLAVTDALTGLASRTHFLELAEDVVAAHPPGRCATVMIDVDHFKGVNDRHGHLAGDAALRGVAEHLTRGLRPTDLLARFGGDEFVALLVDVDPAAAAAVVARLDVPVEVVDGNAAPWRVSLSIGWASSGGSSVTTMLARADFALYAAKAKGRGRAVAAHELVDATTDAPAAAAAVPADGERGRSQVTPGGSQAVPGRPEAAPGRSQAAAGPTADGGRPALRYRPTLDLGDGQVRRVEVRPRWLAPHDSTDGSPDASPDDSPDAGGSDAAPEALVPGVAGRVLDLALDQLATWRAEGLPLAVVVDLPAPALDATLPGRLRDGLVRRGLAPSLLTLAVPQEALEGDHVGGRDVVERLRAGGVRIALGAWQGSRSPLTGLGGLPVDELTLGRALVAPLAGDAGTATLVEGLVGLAHALGLTVVADGVDDERTADVLRRAGCDRIAGDHVAVAMRPGEVAAWLAGRAAARLPRQHAGSAGAAAARPL